MTIDDLVRIAWDTYDNQHTEWDAMRSAVLAVLEAVERECVPEELPFPYGRAHNHCRAEVLRRLGEMKK